MDTFTPWQSLAGGLLIGLSAALLILFNGRIAGISGILASALYGPQQEKPWRWAFLIGLLTAGLVYMLVGLPLVSMPDNRWLTALAGLLVGFGTRLGSGCTSGHGVCGIARLSPRSLLATAVFISTGMLTVYVLRHFPLFMD